MPFNFIIIGFALAALALDKLSIFDDDTADYVNVPIYQVNSNADKTPERTLANKAKVVYPAETLSPRNSIDEYDAMMTPNGTPHASLNVKQVVLGGMVVPTDY
ncbi:hypothetical protein [Photobacterium lutimaris]|uniref:Uncharacterized protein n=1 Tax=Photobacterium lutimaris TaxID=388278 RepID=A0A2T3J3E6_9GAMM|nr:hypothetical protein [Photobacterium lutimaris]PSU35827.1 hypothetical protein C9I99_02065 [Photobacterium lutimaris]TDR78898.1 hypothetical protein DFP78_101412 [Photobacterium lutimaris]